MDANKIFRYKFSEDAVTEIHRFAKVHEHDERNDYKDAWRAWLEEHKQLVESEQSRLKHLGYTGDVCDKMFKSSRYYFRKKSTEKKAPAERRVYTSIPKGVLQEIDRHITNHLGDDDFKPSVGFSAFCNDRRDTLKECIDNLFSQGMTETSDIIHKIKKTYKNRYFVLCKIGL